MRGMGPDGKHLDGPNYIRWAYEMAVRVSRGEYPMRPELGSRIHELHGKPRNSDFNGQAAYYVVEVANQVFDGLVRLATVENVGSASYVDLVIIPDGDSSEVKIEGLRVI